jgi:mRNA interferase RelE/StbE
MTDSRPRWTVIVPYRVEKMLRRVPADFRRRIKQAIDDLADEPRPHGCKKLTGYDDLFRIRVGDWRIIYAIEDDRLIVVVVTLAQRDTAYREL